MEAGDEAPVAAWARCPCAMTASNGRAPQVASGSVIEVDGPRPSHGSVLHAPKAGALRGAGEGAGAGADRSAARALRGRSARHQAAHGVARRGRLGALRASTAAR